MEDRRQVQISMALNPDLRIKCIKISAVYFSFTFFQLGKWWNSNSPSPNQTVQLSEYFLLPPSPISWSRWRLPRQTTSPGPLLQHLQIILNPENEEMKKKSFWRLIAPQISACWHNYEFWEAEYHHQRNPNFLDFFGYTQKSDCLFKVRTSLLLSIRHLKVENTVSSDCFVLKVNFSLKLGRCYAKLSVNSCMHNNGKTISLQFMKILHS